MSPGIERRGKGPHGCVMSYTIMPQTRIRIIGLEDEPYIITLAEFYADNGYCDEEIEEIEHALYHWGAHALGTDVSLEVV